MSKLERRHHARQQRQNKQREHIQTTSVFAGRQGAPRIVTIVPLSWDVDIPSAVRSLSASLGIEEDWPGQEAHTIRVERFKQSIRFVQASGKLFSTLDACRVSDFIVLAFSAQETVNEDAQLLLRAIEGQGVSNVLPLVQNLEQIEPNKKRSQSLQNIKAFLSRYFPNHDKICSLGSISECSNIMRSLCTTTPRGIHWRDDRSWMLVDNVSWAVDSDSNNMCTAVLTGVVRGRPINANRLLQVGDWGDFQIDKIVTCPAAETKRKPTDMVIDDDIKTMMPDNEQDDLDELAPEDHAISNDHQNGVEPQLASESKGVLLDDHHYFSDEDTHEVSRPRRLPRGTSNYQAAWYLDDMSDSGSDLEDVYPEAVDNADAPHPEDGMEGLDTRSMGDATEGAGASEYLQSEGNLDDVPEDSAADLAAYRARRKAAARDDAEFPDEIELAPNVLARERLARYRGLKSLRTSPWVPTEEEAAHAPPEWPRLLEVRQPGATRSAAIREALVGGVPAGTRVAIHIRNVPEAIRAADASRATAGHPLALTSLLRHEHKLAPMHYAFNLRSDVATPLPSKAEVIVQCGPRRFIARPLFSAQGNTANDVHRFERFVHPGRSVVASAIAPVTWGAVPTLFFAREAASGDEAPDGALETTERASSSPSLLSSDRPLALVGTGTVLPPSSSRVIAKRVVLTGHPYRINRKLVTIRYMFFNSEDVRWFAALPLWTKRGRAGFIKEALGTHGHFKATFDARINPQDAVGVSLYKRVWPKVAKRWSLEEKAVEDERIDSRMTSEREAMAVD